MKIGIYSDPHFSQSSSIIVGKKGQFSGRLNNLIESYEWMDKLFKEHGVERVFCLGDLTDKPILSAEEITALSKCPGIHEHHFIVGNHCRSNFDGSINSLSIFDHVYYKPEVHYIGGISFLILPYGCSNDILEEQPAVNVILSHNDIKGYQIGKFVSTEGLELDEITRKCNLFINGHLHNGGWIVPDKVMNIGQLSGMNFSSCGGDWEPSVAILDTDTLKVELFENPVAYRFKKVEFKTLAKVKEYLDSLKSLEGRYVLQIRVPDNLSDKVRSLLSKYDKVEASRIITYCNETKKKSKQVDKKVEELKTSGSVYSKLKNFIDIKGSGRCNPDKINLIIEKVSKEEGEV